MKKTIFALLTLLAFTGCEKVSNTAKNIQSDWIGLDRKVEIYACMSGELIKSYRGSIRMNPEDASGTSLLINGKKLHTNMCYVITEIGIEEKSLIQSKQ